MQKTFIAIAFALTLSCASAAYFNASNYVKGPVTVVSDSEVNYTNASYLLLTSINAGELDIVGANFTANANLTASNWTAVYRKLDGKSLSASANTTITYTGNLQAGVANGYAISFSVDNDTNSVPQISVYQVPINGGTAPARIFVSSNNNSTNSTPQFVYAVQISKTVYVFYSISGTKVNVTSFTIGGSKGSLEFTLTTAFNGSLSVVWGEALGSNQLFANWIDGTVLKDATIDVSKGTVTANVVGAWAPGYVCQAYSTDKKWFGDLCYSVNTTAKTINYYVRSNTTSLAPLTNNFSNTSTLYQTTAIPYGPYLALVYSDTVTSPNGTTYSYDIWNLDTYTAVKNRTIFLTTDSSIQFYRVTSAGFYTLTFNSQQVNGSIYSSNIQVGLVLGGSYLTSVLGFLLTIVAGLLLF